MNQKLFSLKSIGPERRDCTAPYEILFNNYINEHPTVKDFIDFVLSNRLTEWGYIYISLDPSIETVWDIAFVDKSDRLQLFYNWGKVVLDNADIYHTYGHRRISSATSDGGRSRMDYMLVLEEESEEMTDISDDFEINIKKTREFVEKLLEDNFITTVEYNVVTTVLDGAEAHKQNKEIDG